MEINNIFRNRNISTKCQCCLSVLASYENRKKVTEDIETKFYSLIQIEAEWIKKDTESVTSVICLRCDSKLTEFTEFRNEILRAQSENFFVKTEATETIKIECESDPYETDPTEEYLENFEPFTDADTIRKNITRRQNDSVSSQDHHSCEICPEKYYKSKYSLEKHMILNHQVEKPRKEKFPKTNLCFICAKIITNGKRGLEYHMGRVHSEEFKYFCDLCPRKAKMRSDLESHMKSHVQKEFREKFPCETCGETFNQRQSLEMHRIMKHSESPPDFICECGKSFRTLKHYKYHQKEMHETGLFPCDKCRNKVFNTKIKLNRHQREFHAQDKPCEICGKMIRGHLTMARHMKGHKSPDFRCSYDGCNRQFFGKSALNDHIATKHEKNESFICPTCGSSFATIRNMNKHIQRQHTSLKIPCQILNCKYVTSRKDYLASHYKTHKDIDDIRRNELVEGIKDIRGIGW